MKYNTLPTDKHERFYADWQGANDGLKEVFPVYLKGTGTVMCVNTSDGYVYITREQARLFFDLSKD